MSEPFVNAAALEVDPAELAGDLAAPAPPRRIEGRSPGRLAWERLRRDRVAIASMVFIVLIVVMALCAPLISHAIGHGPNEQFRDTGALDAFGQPHAPSSRFWMGTDELGRDVLVRIAYGARISLLVGLVSSALAVILGVVIGLAAGYFGGFVDTALARIVDISLALPFLLFAISLVAVFGPSLWASIFVIAVFSWGAIARIVRGQVLSIREREYVEAARSLGASDARILRVDILPNVLAPVLVYSTLLVPVVIVTEATLSFLGLGVPDPTATWGKMIARAESGGLYQVAWWYALFPSLFLLFTTLAFNLLGDSVRDAFDPRGDRLLNGK